jgi:magnesium chelatase family protein
VVNLTRLKRTCEFPARFQLVAAMNPCPCGYAGDPRGRCNCTVEKVARYRHRISGPLIDRIDIHVELPALPVEHLLCDVPAQTETLSNRRSARHRGPANSDAASRQVQRPADAAGSDAFLRPAARSAGPAWHCDIAIGVVSPGMPSGAEARADLRRLGG